jgi:FtsH-binding integral membrane protein
MKRDDGDADFSLLRFIVITVEVAVNGEVDASKGLSAAATTAGEVVGVVEAVAAAVVREFSSVSRFLIAAAIIWRRRSAINLES